jgi:hypothetical protein
MTRKHRQKGHSNMKFIKREKGEEKEKKINVSKKNEPSERKREITFSSAERMIV